MNNITIYLLLGIFSNIFFCSYFLYIKNRQTNKLDSIIALITIFIFPILWIKFIKEEIFKL